LRDALDARYAMIRAVNRLPSDEAIAYERSEPEALLIARVLRLCADAPLTKLEAARINAELHTSGRADEANSAYRNSRHGYDENDRVLATVQLESVTAKAFKKARGWIKVSVDRFALRP